jgi:hypothetical protein
VDSFEAALPDRARFGLLELTAKRAGAAGRVDEGARIAAPDLLALNFMAIAEVAGRNRRQNQTATRTPCARRRFWGRSAKANC